MAFFELPNSSSDQQPVQLHRHEALVTNTVGDSESLLQTRLGTVQESENKSGSTILESCTRSPTNRTRSGRLPSLPVRFSACKPALSVAALHRRTKMQK